MTAAALLLAVGVGIAGCRQQAPQIGTVVAPAAAPAAPKPYRTYLFSNVKAHLRPLQVESQVDAEQAKKIWYELLPGMVADPKSQELMRQLHGGLSVELSLVDAKQAEDEAVMAADPPQGITVAFRVADKIVAEESLYIGLKPVPARVVNYGQVVLIEDAAVKSVSNVAAAQSSLTNVFQEVPPYESLYLVMEDYIARHAPGWILIRDVSPEEPKLPADVAEQRRDLDQRIKSQAEKATAYFDTLRKERNDGTAPNHAR